jgi:lipid-binding SYLF domain-containing protein
MITDRAFRIFLVLFVFAVSLRAQDLDTSEDLSVAINRGHVTVAFHATGASSGDSILLTIAKAPYAPSSRLLITVSPGLRLNNLNPTSQSMVIERIQGRMVGQDSYVPAKIIELSDSSPVTYMLAAYCAEFHKSNPSPASVFNVGSTDPALACILYETARQNLSLQATQAAVWNYTDRITFEGMNQKFFVSPAHWAAAASVTQYCAGQSPASSAQITTQPAPSAPVVINDSSDKDFVATAAARAATAARVLTEVMSVPGKAIPSAILTSTKCLIVIPSLQRGDGSGVVTCRTDRGWSAPGFLRSSETSIGFFAAGQSVDLVLLIMSDHGMQSLLHEKFKPGAAISIEPGPLGHMAVNNKSLMASVDVYAYGRFRGLLAGIKLNRAVIAQDKGATRELWGRNVPIAEILTGSVETPQAGETFLKSVLKATGEESPR